MRLSLTAASVVLCVTALGSTGCAGARANDAAVVTVASLVSVKEAGAEGVAHVPARNALDAPGAFAIVDAETGWLILADGLKEDALASAPVDTSLDRNGDSSGLHVLEAKLKLAELGPEMRLEGRSFVLYQGAEKRCTVRAGALRGVGFTSDDFTPDESEPTPKPTAEEQAREKWAASNTYVAAKIALAPDCKGATWARLEELPAPRFVTTRDPVPPVAEQAVAAFQARPTWVQAQTSYVESPIHAPQANPDGTWEGLGRVTLSELEAPFAGGSFVVRQSVWDEGCGANAGLTMVWRDAGGRLSQVFEGDDRFALEVAMDLDGDGTLEMFGTEGDGPSLRPFWGTEKEDTRQGPILTHAYAFHGCRC